MDKSHLENLVKQAIELKSFQESKDDVSSLPTLEISDISPDVICIKPSYETVTYTCYEQPTSGICYFTSVFGIGNVSIELIPLINFFCYAVTKMGTKKRNYVEMARLIDSYTGGTFASANVSISYDEKGDCLPFISFSSKCLNRNINKMFDIISEFYFDFDFSNIDRLRNIFKEYRAAMEYSIIESGHKYATNLASRIFSKASFLSEIWSGIHQLKMIKQIELSDESLKNLSEKLFIIADKVFKSNGFKIALVGEQSSLDKAKDNIKAIHEGLGIDNKNSFYAPDINLSTESIKEGWIIASQVSFVAKIFETARMSHEDAPVLSVISRMLKLLYLHREIREKGGAYGGYSTYTAEDGLFAFASYRDPHIISTLKTYDNAVDFINNPQNYSDEDIKEAILQVCATIDKPDSPGIAAKKAFYRKLMFLSDDIRINFKQKLLSLKKEDVTKVAQKYFGKKEKKEGIVVISSEEKLKEANEKLLNNPFKLNLI
ncbi:MAG: hypothetical protein HQK79_18750 [Desulfobacterales bacterium]|nr:hypothetical protein [Desulfobacterales bacterium]